MGWLLIILRQDSLTSVTKERLGILMMETVLLRRSTLITGAMMSIQEHSEELLIGFLLHSAETTNGNTRWYLMRLLPKLVAELLKLIVQMELVVRLCSIKIYIIKCTKHNHKMKMKIYFFSHSIDINSKYYFKNTNIL